MPRSPDEQAVIDDFARIYKIKRTPVWQQIECCVYGCDYGATSWTTRQEADVLGKELSLGAGKTFLDIGAGSGWPSLYLAESTGCNAVLTDIPLSGMRIARDRIAADGLSERCLTSVADGAQLPFAEASFDAVFHSDVLCCMNAKRDLLQECRRVLRPDGKLTFVTLSVVPGLSDADYRKAVAWGPPFIDTSTDYATLLRQTGWEPIKRVDVTAAYSETLHAMRRQEEDRETDLMAVHGEEAYAARMAGSDRRLAAVEQHLIRREQFSAVPVQGGGI